VGEYYFTTDDRRVQLSNLAVALRNLIPLVAALSSESKRATDYASALQRCEELLEKGFTQTEISALARSVPDLYARHKEWVPPLEQTPAGRWQEPAWFVDLEARLQPALQAAEVLRQVGYH
jgi:hypothetical protein